MKRVMILSLAGLFSGVILSGQCIPDTVNCVDTEGTGVICPRYLPDAVVNAYYDEVITVIPPSEVTSGSQTAMIDYIVIDSITNIPDGVSYAANAQNFYAGSAYCIQVYGTPTKSGSDTLKIYVTPYIFFVNTTIPGPQVVNDTSVVLTVVEASGIDPGLFTEFHLLPTKPNPFSELTSIGFFTPFDDLIKLEVYNILGILVHSEEQGFPPGEYNFEFNGESLEPGTYFYRVSNHDQYQTGKIIKTRR